MFLDKPHLASRYYGRLVQDSDELFSNSHVLLSYYISAYALYKVEYLIRNKQIDQSYNRYRFHIIMLIKYLALGNTAQPPLNSHNMERLCQRIQNVLNSQEKLLSYVSRACEIIDSQVDDVANTEYSKTLSVVDKLIGAVRSAQGTP